MLDVVSKPQNIIIIIIIALQYTFTEIGQAHTTGILNINFASKKLDGGANYYHCYFVSIFKNIDRVYFNLPAVSVLRLHLQIPTILMCVCVLYS